MFGRRTVRLFGRYIMLPDRPSIFQCKPCKVNFLIKENLEEHVKKHRMYKQTNGRMFATFD